MKEKSLVASKLKIIGLCMYFIILFGERLCAVFCSFKTGGEYALSSGHVFNFIAYAVTVISIGVSVPLSVNYLYKMMGYLSKKEPYPFEENYKKIIIGFLALLFAGMMHTGFTVAPVQFVAYGFLIFAMAVRCVEECKENRERRFASIVSLIYLTLFSMTIPVCYIALKLGVLTIPFFAVEFAAVFVLIPLFGRMLYRFFTDGVTDFSFVYPLVMLILSGLTVALKWSEEINWFVLIFVVLTIIFYLTFGIIASMKIKKNK